MPKLNWTGRLSDRGLSANATIEVRVCKAREQRCWRERGPMTATSNRPHFSRDAMPRFNYSDPSYARLWERFRSGRDQHSRNDLLLAYEPLVLLVINQLSPGLRAYWDRDDLQSFGILGLLAAIDRFTPDSPIGRFPTYASTCIKGAIFDEMRRLDWLPRGIRRHVTEYRHAADSLGHELGREPATTEILDSMGVSGDTRGDVLAGVHSSQLLHLDHVVEVESADGTFRLVETLTDERVAGPEEAAVASDELLMLRRAVEDLPERQRLVVTLHLFKGFTLEQVGTQIGVTASRACQIEAEAVKNLRRILGQEASELVEAPAV